MVQDTKIQQALWGAAYVLRSICEAEFGEDFDTSCEEEELCGASICADCGCIKDKRQAVLAAYREVGGTVDETL